MLKQFSADNADLTKNYEGEFHFSCQCSSNQTISGVKAVPITIILRNVVDGNYYRCEFLRHLMKDDPTKKCNCTIKDYFIFSK